MVYPLLPLFLTRVLGASAMSLGVIEGVAEGGEQHPQDRLRLDRRSDRRSRRSSCSAGYGLSSLVRPLMGVRHGLAAGARAALHRSAGQGHPDVAARRDAGALRAREDAAAASTASTARWITPARSPARSSRPPSSISIRRPIARSSCGRSCPGSSSSCSSCGCRTRRTGRTRSCDPRTESSLGSPRSSHPATAAVAASTWPWRVILLFALGNASDAFILLRLNDLGVAPVWIPLLWSALHVVKMSSSVLGGALSDRFGRRDDDRARLSVVRGDLRGVRLVRRSLPRP